MGRVSSTFVSGTERGESDGVGCPTPSIHDYEQLVETILIDCTSSRGCMPWLSPLRDSSREPVVPVAAPVVVGVDEDAVVPAPAAELVDVWLIAGSNVVLPVT